MPPNRSELRDFIPSGNCVPRDPSASASATETDPPTAEVFARIDTGHTTQADIALARAACRDCLQLNYCKDQLPQIVDALWARGALSAVVGGQHRDRGPDNSPAASLETSFRFDLSRLPSDAGQRLSLIRQGLRAEQLWTVSRAPANIRLFIDEYERLLAERDNRLLANACIVLSDAERDKAMRYIILALCQQADFENFTNKRKSGTKGTDNRRYQVADFDFEGNYATIHQYLQEVIDLKKLGATSPGAVAAYHSVEFCERLIVQYGRHLSRSRLFILIRNNPRNPQPAIESFVAKMQAERMGAVSDKPRETAIARKIVSGKVGAAAIQQAAASDAEQARVLEDRIADARTVYPYGHHIVDQSTVAHFARRPSYREDLAKFVEAYRELTRLYGPHPDFSESTIKRFARNDSAKNPALEQARAYLDRLMTWRRWATGRKASQTPVSDSFLREFALRGDVSSFEAIARAYKLKVIKMRFDARKRRYSNPGLETWMIYRMLALYQIDDVDQAAEGLFQLRGHGILDYGISELEELQWPEQQSELSAVSDPRNWRHVTFTAQMRMLNSAERLALAHHFQVSRLIYGRDFVEQQITEWLGVNDLDVFVEENLLPKCAALLATTDFPIQKRPLALSELGRDITSLDQYVVSADQRPAPDDKDLGSVAVIGGLLAPTAIPLSASHSTESILAKAEHEWLIAMIHKSYPPSEQADAYTKIEDALRREILIIKIVDGHYTISLADIFYSDLYSDVDNAAVAHVLGLDRLLYGQDLSAVLRDRLGQTDLHGYAEKKGLLAVEGWELLEEVLFKLNCSQYALSVILAMNKAKPEQLRRSRSGEVHVRTELVAAITGHSYPPAPIGWISHESLLANAKFRARFARMQFDPSDRGIFASASGKIDVYYSRSRVQKMLI